MSLRPQTFSPVPEQTERVARAAFPNGNLYMRMRDEFGTIFSDEQFAALFPQRGQPAESPWRLALVTVMQFMENLTDRQAADAVRRCIDWKYALNLELTDPGFNFSVLSEFRARLVHGQAEQVLFETLLQHFQERGLLKTEKRQRTDSTHIVGCIRRLNQLELVGETLRHTLNVLALVDPAWLKSQAPAEWYDRYGQPLSDYRLPRGEKERQQLAQTVGRDGIDLMEQIYSPNTPDWLRQLPAVETLRRVWVQEFYIDDGSIHCRTADNSPPTGSQICSPYDLDAHYGRKRNVRWIGYKVHLTETCEPDAPNLITQVETTVGSVSDVNTLEAIHYDLADHARLPSEHIVDAGYVTSDTLADSQREHGVTLLGPVRPDPSWQAAEGTGFDLEHFTVDWENQVVICPQGKRSQKWQPNVGRRGKPNILVEFRRTDCQVCPARKLCVRNKKQAVRNLTLQRREEFEALRAARRRQQWPDFQERYALRAGIEGTVSQAAFALGMRRTRYRGLPKVHLQHLLVAAAMNLARAMNWLAEVPRSHVRLSPFAKLVAVT